MKIKILTVIIALSIVAGFGASAANNRELPAWVFGGNQPIPDWLYSVDELPDWFYDLPSEPTWYRQIDRIPAWFYTITEIPDWFYPAPGEEMPAINPEDEPVIPGVPEPEVPAEPEFKIYEYRFGENEKLTTNIPKGIITDDRVILDFTPGTLGITQNGDFISYRLGDYLTESGKYTLVLASDFVTEVFDFTIVSTPVNFLSAYTVPEDFTIVEALFAGTSRQIPNNKSFEMNSDGDYQFTITDKDFETVYTVSLTLKTAPPVLTFSRLTEDGEKIEVEWTEEGGDAFEGPIVYSSSEIDDYTISVTYNRSAINTPGNHTLRESGRYRINVVDAAGNTAQYTFRIIYIMDVPTGWIIAISAILLAALTAYLIRYRIKARVR